MNRGLLLIVFMILAATFSAKSQFVFKTPTGKKYHLGSCRMVENVSAKITVQQALDLDLEPCKICKPDNKLLLTSSSDSKKPNGQSATTQCKGVTKAGSRCKHMTRIGNGYCYQHQPK